MTYRWTLTMAMSIVHRITGLALYFGTLLLVWWLLATASGPQAYATFQGFIGSWFGRLILFGYTWALIHHLLGGVRHLIWDLGYGFGPNEREWLTRAAVIGSIVADDRPVDHRLRRGRPAMSSSKSRYARRSAACAVSAPRAPAPATSGASA